MILIFYWPTPTESFRFKVCVESCEAGDNYFGIPGFSTKEYYDRYCLPDTDSDVKISGYDTIAGFASRGVADLKTALPIVGGSLVIATVMALFYIWLMKLCIGCLVWGTIIGIILGGFLASLSFLAKADDLKDAGDKKGAKTQQGIGWAIAIMTVIFLFIIIFMRKRIKIAIEVIKSASRAIGDMKCIVFFPLIPILILGAFFIAWLYSLSFFKEI